MVLATHKATVGMVTVGSLLSETITINTARSVDPGSPLAKNGLLRRIQKEGAMCIKMCVSVSATAAKNCHFNSPMKKTIKGTLSTTDKQ